MKLNIQHYIAGITLFATSIFGVKGQQNESLTFHEFLNQVGNKNLSYAAQKYNVSMSEAAIQTASMFPDPQLGLDGSDNGINRQMGYTIGGNIGWTLEMGGKRKARIDLARNNSELSKIQLEDFFRNLRADAAFSYVDALKAKSLLDVQKDSYKNMDQLAKSDSIRYKFGAISLVTSKQDRKSVV